MAGEPKPRQETASLFLNLKAVPPSDDAYRLIQEKVAELQRAIEEAMGDAWQLPIRFPDRYKMALTLSTVNEADGRVQMTIIARLHEVELIDFGDGKAFRDKHTGEYV